MAHQIKGPWTYNVHMIITSYLEIANCQERRRTLKKGGKAKGGPKKLLCRMICNIKNSFQNSDLASEWSTDLSYYAGTFGIQVQKSEILHILYFVETLHFLLFFHKTGSSRDPVVDCFNSSIWTLNLWNIVLHANGWHFTNTFCFSVIHALVKITQYIKVLRPFSLNNEWIMILCVRFLWVKISTSCEDRAQVWISTAGLPQPWRPAVSLAGKLPPATSAVELLLSSTPLLLRVTISLRPKKHFRDWREHFHTVCKRSLCDLWEIFLDNESCPEQRSCHKCEGRHSFSSTLKKQILSQNSWNFQTYT